MVKLAVGVLLVAVLGLAGALGCADLASTRDVRVTVVDERLLLEPERQHPLPVLRRA